MKKHTPFVYEEAKLPDLTPRIFVRKKKDSDMEWEQWAAVPTMAVIITAAVVINYFGSKRSLLFASAGKAAILDTKEAMKFPLIGSAVLISLYVVLMYLRWLNVAITVYLVCVGIVSLATCVKPHLGASIPLGVVCVAIGALYIWSHHWLINNILGVAICLVAIETIQLPNLVTSSVLLIGLFFYDIFWVFGTTVMVSVAKNIDGPIKVELPRNFFGESRQLSMLGLGDIVIPGFFISQMLRFSVHVGRGNKYFRAAMYAYTASLINTVAVMLVFNAAQPALLYIVPWLLITICIVTWIGGDFGKLVQYDDVAAYSKKTDDKKDEPAVEEPSTLKFLCETAKGVFGLDEETLGKTEKKELKEAAAPKRVASPPRRETPKEQ